MDFITTNAYSCEDLILMLKKAVVIKQNKQDFINALAGKFLYMLFQKTSTRTALSFAAGITELGGSYLFQKWEDSNFCIGEIEDEARYVATSAHACIARLKNNEDIVRLAKSAPIPVINGCCNKYHPCQAMADMLTIFELFGTCKVNMCYVGVRNNVFNSLVSTFTRLGGVLYAITPLVNELSNDESVIARGRESGRLVELEPNVAEMASILKSVDVVYVDTWVDMELFNVPSYQMEKQRRISTLMPFQLNENVLAGSKAIVMHDMPMHPGYEITREVIEANISTILQQADNRKFGQEAILLTLLENDHVRGLFSKCSLNVDR